MNKLCKILALLLLTLALMLNGSGIIVAQAPTTTVQDTIYKADGTPAAGQVIVSWNAFTTASGAAMPAGSTTATISAGTLTLALTPNAGSTPMGSYYTALFHLNDGTTSKEYWVVPVTVPGGGPAKLAAIRNQVLPLSVAMETVSKQYVDTAIAAAAFGVSPLLPPVFGPSGTTHAVGAVPDPGATAGATRYLREDGTWNVPTGGSSGTAGGDLSGSYPNPTVTAVHATSGTLDDVTVGATTAAPVIASLLTVQPTATSGHSVTLTTTQSSGEGILLLPGGGWQGGSDVSLYMGATDHSLKVSYSGADIWSTYSGLQFVQQGATVLTAGGPDGANTGFVGVATAHPLAQFSVGASSQFQVNGNGAITKSTGVASGSSANTDLVGTLVLASGSTTSASYTFSGTYTSAPVCVVQPQSVTPGVVAGLSAASAQVTTTGLNVTVGSAPGSNVTFGYVCTGRN